MAGKRLAEKAIISNEERESERKRHDKKREKKRGTENSSLRQVYHGKKC